MKIFLIAASAVAALAIAAPALAQPYAPVPPTTDAAPGHDIQGQLDTLRARVKAGFDQGQISKGKTDGFYRDIDRIAAVANSDRKSDGQFSEHDRTDVQGRIDDLSRSIH